MLDIEKLLVLRFIFFSFLKKEKPNRIPATAAAAQRATITSKPKQKYKMRALIVFSCLAFAAARPEAGYSYQRPGGSGSLSGVSGSSFGIGHGGGSFGHGGSFSSGGSSFGSGGVCVCVIISMFCFVFVWRIVENE